MNREILFLDIETTGLDPNVNKMLSLGMLFNDKDGNIQEFYKEIVFDDKDPNFSPDARKMNKELIEGNEPKFLISIVEKEAINWLKRVYRAKFKNPKGFNISNMDMKFIEIHMPALYKELGYRSQCLNQLIGHYSDITNLDYWAVKTAITEKVSKTGRTITHNALDDCYSSLETYRVILTLFEPRLG